MALRLANGAQGAMDRDAPGAFARQADCCGDRPAEECSRWVARIDAALASTWLYPTNYPVRAYQESIVKQCLLKNTLVCLPTGLGKTLIAAVLMYNYHRWFPEGQIIFMAPTRPLVGQQVAACHGVVGLPEGDTAEINGTVDQRRRRQLWAQRRVFYCTPQTVQNDLENGALDCSRVVLVVVDEAHRALKKYAYCGVVRAIAKRQSHFRVLALSATPGSDIAGVQAVIDNLRIAHVEVRSEADAEVAPHTHARLGAAKESEIPNFKGFDLGHFPLVSADFWTSDHLLERPRSVDAFSGTRARGTLTFKRR